MSQEELGELLGVKRSAIQKYESGAIEHLRADKIKILCHIFRTLPRFFIFEDDEEYGELVLGQDKATLDRWITSNFNDPLAIAVLEQTIENMDVLRIMTSIADLNSAGTNKVIEYIKDIHKIDEYLHK